MEALLSKNVWRQIEFVPRDLNFLCSTLANREWSLILTFPINEPVKQLSLNFCSFDFARLANYWPSVEWLCYEPSFDKWPSYQGDVGQHRTFKCPPGWLSTNPSRNLQTARQHLQNRHPAKRHPANRHPVNGHLVNWATSCQHGSGWLHSGQPPHKWNQDDRGTGRATTINQAPTGEESN